MLIIWFLLQLRPPKKIVSDPKAGCPEPVEPFDLFAALNIPLGAMTLILIGATYLCALQQIHTG